MPDEGRRNDELEVLRGEMDGIDEELIRLLNRRAGLAKAIWQHKQAQNLSNYSPARERHIRERLRQRNPGPLSEDQLWDIYREILSACRAVQRSLRLAFLGPRGTFTEIAARRVFGSQAEFLPLETVEQVFEEFRKGNADVGVVPLENSVEGVERRTLDLLHRYSPPVTIQAEVYVDIHQCFLVRHPDEETRFIYSHPQAFAQCSRWLMARYPGAELIPANSTARGAELAAQREQAAAIGPALAAEIYQLYVLHENIEDYSDNRTRFIVIGPGDPTTRTGKDKTSMVMATWHRSGALCDALLLLKQHGLNMTMIESRPSRETRWEYVFFIDFEGHTDEPRVKQAIKELEAQSRLVKILGSYPSGE